MSASSCCFTRASRAPSKPDARRSAAIAVPPRSAGGSLPDALREQLGELRVVRAHHRVDPAVEALAPGLVPAEQELRLRARLHRLLDAVAGVVVLVLDHVL